jgi:hypothetical protein
MMDGRESMAKKIARPLRGNMGCGGVNVNQAAAANLIETIEVGDTVWINKLVNIKGYEVRGCFFEVLDIQGVRLTLWYKFLDETVYFDLPTNQLEQQISIRVLKNV